MAHAVIFGKKPPEPVEGCGCYATWLACWAHLAEDSVEKLAESAAFDDVVAVEFNPEGLPQSYEKVFGIFTDEG